MTKFASPERSDPETIQKDYDNFYNDTMLSRVIATVPNIVLVLNKNRQAVFCNNKLLETLGLDDNRVVLGLRPGEIFNCIHSSLTESGCGTTEFCRTCGAVKAILETQKNGAHSRYECTMLTNQDNGLRALNIEVYTDELVLEDEKFTIFHITNIDSKKSEEALGHLLFSDVLTTTENMIGSLDIISSASDKEQIEEYILTLRNSSMRLADEIKSRQELIFLEERKIEVKQSEIHSLIFMLEIIKKFIEHPFAKDKKLIIDPNSSSIGFVSDPELLTRAFKNLLINALENSVTNGNVVIGCIYEKERIQFWIKNTTVIPEEVKNGIFNKSFTTKTAGCGYGTYTSKLIIENLLGGSLTFISNETDGTIFIIDLPVKN